MNFSSAGFISLMKPAMYRVKVILNGTSCMVGFISFIFPAISSVVAIFYFSSPSKFRCRVPRLLSLRESGLPNRARVTH